MLITLLLVVVIGGLAILVLSENREQITIFIAYFEITTELGIAIVVTFMLGLLLGLIMYFSRDMFDSPGGD